MPPNNAVGRKQRIEKSAITAVVPMTAAAPVIALGVAAGAASIAQRKCGSDPGARLSSVPGPEKFFGFPLGKAAGGHDGGDPQVRGGGREGVPPRVRGAGVTPRSLVA